MKNIKHIVLLSLIMLSFTQSSFGQGVNLDANEKAIDLEYIYPFSERLSKVMKDGKWGFINEGNEIKIPLKYDDASSFLYGVSRVQRGAKFSAIDFKGKQIMPWFDYVYPYYNDLAKVKNRNKLAFVDKKGRIVSDWFDASFVYYYGLTKVKKGHKWAFMDTKGKVVTQWYFNPDTLNVKIEIRLKTEREEFSSYVKKTVAIYNEKGERITKEYPSVFYNRSFDNTALFDSLKYDKFIATSNHSLYTENISLIKNKKGQVAFQNDGGTQLTEWLFEAENYYEGVARMVNLEGKMAYLGNNGKQITAWFDRVYPFFNRLALVENNGKYAFIDKMGSFKTDWYDYASQFSDGFAKVSIDRKWGFINDKGKVVINILYDDATSFSYGYARVEIEGKQLIINKRNKVMHDAFDYLVTKFTDSIAAIQVENKFAYIDRTGTRITPWLDCASDFSYGLARVCLEGKIALINNQGKIITPWYEKAILAPPHLVLGDTLPHGKIGRYILFDLYKYDNYFNKYASGTYYDNYYQMNWNYTNREAPMSWNDGFFKEGVEVAYKAKNGKYGIHNYEGAALSDYNGRPISAWYDTIYKSDDGLITAQKEGKHVLLNLYGDELSKQYDGIYYYKENQIKVKLNNQFNFIDRKDTTLTLWYDEIEEFKKGYALVKDTGKYALMTDKFDVISNWYDQIDSEFTNDMRRVKRNGKWGAISRQGFDVVEPKYDDASFINGLLRVRLNTIYYLYDINGNLIKTE